MFTPYYNCCSIVPAPGAIVPEVPPPMYFQYPLYLDGGFAPVFGGYEFQPEFPVQPQEMLPRPFGGYAFQPEFSVQLQEMLPMPLMNMLPTRIIEVEPLGGGYRDSLPRKLARSGGRGARRNGNSGNRQSFPRPQRQDGCGFCISTGECKDIWSSHSLRQDGKITCPVLRKYVCPICKAEGDNAHTISYCPENTTKEAGHIHVRTGHNAAGNRINFTRNPRPAKPIYPAVQSTNP